MNLAGVIRMARFGPKDARRRLAAAYRQIDPFGDAPHAEATDEDARARDECLAALALIPEVELATVVRGRPIIRVDGVYRYVEGTMPWCDITAFLAVLVDRAPRVVLEIGTFHGHVTRLIALNLPSATIHTVDLPEDYDAGSDPSSMPKDDLHLIGARRVGVEYRSDPSITNVVQHFGDSADWDFGVAEAATFYLIDGAHTYEYARSDTHKALAAARGRDATLMWHDCDRWHPGVIRWISEMVASGHPVRRIAETNLAVMDVPALGPDRARAATANPAHRTGAGASFLPTSCHADTR
jgi:hypothetical protein